MFSPSITLRPADVATSVTIPRASRGHFKCYRGSGCQPGGDRAQGSLKLEKPRVDPQNPLNFRCRLLSRSGLALHVILLHVGHARPAIGGQLLAPGRRRFGLFQHGLGPCDDALLHVLLNVFPRETEASTHRGGRIFGINGPQKLGDQHDSFQGIEVGHVATGRRAEIGRVGNGFPSFCRQMTGQRLAADRLALGATMGAVVGCPIRFADKGLIHRGFP